MNQLVEPVVSQHKATEMLREMARRAHEVAGEIERQAQAPVAKIEVESLDVLVLDAFL